MSENSKRTRSAPIGNDSSNQSRIRKKHTGQPGNGGQFDARERSEPQAIALPAVAFMRTTSVKMCSMCWTQESTPDTCPDPNCTNFSQDGYEAVHNSELAVGDAIDHFGQRLRIDGVRQEGEVTFVKLEDRFEEAALTQGPRTARWTGH